ncbi:unnamed protein product [Parnassius apollo]|uniref:(apollo) hypothetical protein n=1 Tax=Parnassius apollo TaxID=110799 RepID=A0A8S3WWP2_PARAO|nr:unnamed protein product [Parnassius apollo]
MVSDVGDDFNEPDLLRSFNLNSLVDDFQQDSVSINCEGPQFCNEYRNHDDFNHAIEFSEFNNPPTLSDDLLDYSEISLMTGLLQNQEILDIPIDKQFPIAEKVSSVDNVMSKKKVKILKPINRYNEHLSSAIDFR